MRKWCVAVAVFATILSLGPVQAQTVIFSDDFEGRTEGSGDPNGSPAGAGNGFGGWGSNNNNLGGVVTSMYSVGPERAGGRNQVVGLNAFDNSLGGNGFLFDGAAAVNVAGLTAASPLGFTVAFDFDRIADPSIMSGGNGYLAFGVGLDNFASLGNGAALSRSAFGVLFQQAVAPNAANARTYSEGDTVAHDVFDYVDPDGLHSALLTFTPTTPGAYGSGDTIDFDVTIDGNSLSSGTFTSNGNDLNNLVFSANDPAFQARYVDNLVVSSITAIPEPGSFAALLGLTSVITVRRRRRNAS